MNTLKILGVINRIMSIEIKLGKDYNIDDITDYVLDIINHNGNTFLGQGYGFDVNLNTPDNLKEYMDYFNEIIMDYGWDIKSLARHLKFNDILNVCVEEDFDELSTFDNIFGDEGIDGDAPLNYIEFKEFGR